MASFASRFVPAQGSRPASFRAAPAAESPPRLILLARANAGFRRDWCELFAQEGYDTLAPELAEGRAGAGDMALLADLAGGFDGNRGDTGIGVVGLDCCAELAAAGVRAGLIDVGVVFSDRDLQGLFGDRAFPRPFAVHLSLGQGAELEAVQAAADRLDLQLFATETQAGFVVPGSPAYDRHAAAVAHSRTLSVLRPVLGPKLDLGRLFRGHLAQEFRHHDADATMATMIAEPYVNHVPTLTGGYGHAMLKRFYKYHFIPSAARNADRETVVISETVGADTVVLEMVIGFVHDEEHEYMLPGVRPTGRKVRLPSVVIAKFRGDKLCHEHIYWDQASLLAQIGAIDPAGLPITAAEQARKVLNPSLVPSNELMTSWPDSEGLPL